MLAIPLWGKLTLLNPSEDSMQQLDIFGGSTALRSSVGGQQLSLLSANHVRDIIYPAPVTEDPLPVLRLNLKKEYFEAIASGAKTEEYRLCNEYWHKRLVGKKYSKIEICLGYPPKGDTDRVMTFPYRGFEVKHIDPAPFGSLFHLTLSRDAVIDKPPKTVKVYAITLRP